MPTSSLRPGATRSLRSGIAVALLLLCGVTQAQDPPPLIECVLKPPDLMAYPRLVGSPHHAGGAYDPTPYADLEITILYNGLPVPDAYVEIQFGPSCDQLCLCVDPGLTGLTDSQGHLDLNIGVGGCCHNYDAVTVVVNAIQARALDMFVSPDYCATGGDCQVTLCDFSYFGVHFMAGSSGCTDFNGSGATGVGDFVVFASGGWGRDCPTQRE